MVVLICFPIHNVIAATCLISRGYFVDLWSHNQDNDDIRRWLQVEYHLHSIDLSRPLVDTYVMRTANSALA